MEAQLGNMAQVSDPAAVKQFEEPEQDPLRFSFRQVFQQLYGVDPSGTGERPKGFVESVAQLGKVAQAALGGRGGMEGAGQLVGVTLTPKAPEYFQAVLKKIVAENAPYDAGSLILQTLKSAKSWGHKLEQFKQFRLD